MRRYVAERRFAACTEFQVEGFDLPFETAKWADANVTDFFVVTVLPRLFFDLIVTVSKIAVVPAQEVILQTIVAGTVLPRALAISIPRTSLVSPEEGSTTRRRRRRRRSRSSGR